MNHWQIGEMTSRIERYVYQIQYPSNRNLRRKKISEKKIEGNDKNCEPWILPYFQAKKLAGHSFIEIGRRHKTGSEIKHFDTYSTERTMSIRIFASVPVPPNVAG